MSTAIGAGISGVFGEKPGSGVSAYDNIYSVHFDSPAHRINCGDSSSFSFPGTVASDRAFSISTWVYFVDTVISVQICGKGDVGTADAEYNLETDPLGRVRIRLYDSNVSSTSTSYWQGRNNTVLETNKWYHIVATFDGTTPNAQSNSIRIYVNNQLNNVVTRVNTPGPFVQMFDNGGKFILGTTDGVNSKNIYMDEAAIFNRALTQADINYLYSIPFTPNLTVNGNFTELGPELNPNSTFDNLGSNVLTSTWVPGAGWSVITDGVSCDGSNGNVRQNIEMTDFNGRIFLLTYTLSNVTDSTTLNAKFGGGSNVALTSTEGTHTVYLTNDATVDNFQFTSGGNWAGDITNISLKEISAITGYSDNGQGDPTPAILSWDSSTQNLEFTSFQAGRGAFNNGTVDTPNLIIPISSNKTYLVSCESATSTTTHGIRIGSTQISASFWESDFISTPRKIERFITNYSSSIQEVFLYLRNALAGTTQWSEASVKEVTDWTFGDGWSVNSSNQAEYDGTGTTASALEQTVATYEDGKKYQVQFQLDGSLNGVAVSINGGTAVNALRSTTDNSSRSVTVIAGSGSNSLKITPLGATDTFTISDITSKLVTSLAAPNTDKDDARAVDLTGMSDLDHWWRMGDTQGPATYPVIHDVVYNPFGDQLVENGNFDELGPQLIKNPLFGLGPEEVTNGHFSDGTNGWSFSNAGGTHGWRIADGRAICDTNAAIKNRNLTSSLSLDGSKDYKLTLDILQSADNITVYVGGTALSTTLPTGTNIGYEYYISSADHSGGALMFYAGSSDLQEIDNISVKEIPHWRLTQATISNGTASFATTDGSFAGIRQNVFTPGKTYLISLDVDDLVGIAEVNTNGGTSIGLEITTNGSKSFYMKAENTDIEIKRKFGVTNTSATISNIVVKQVDPEDDWTKGTGWSIGDGKATSDGSQTANSLLYQSGILSIGTTFKAQLTLSNHQSGTLRFVLGGGGSEISCSSNGTFTFYGNKGTDNNLYLSANSTFEGSVDNVSVQQVSDTSGIMENMNPDNIVAFSPPDPDPLVGDEFIFSVNTAQSGVSNSNQFQLPLISAGTLDFTVIWGDGTQDIITSYNQAETLHTYPSSGTYTIGIRANTQPLKGFKFDSGGDKLKMSNIVNWGGSNFNLDQQEAFYGCANMTCTATDAPLIATTVFYRMFRGCTNFNGDLSNWDVSNVTSLAQMFYSCNAFTGKGLENWDISSADAIEYMFFNCPNFNGKIGGWNTSGVTTMRYVFQQCSIFNQDISSWDTSLVTRMNNMFQDAFEFNQPLNSWDVSSCVDFASMFKNATKFNQPLNNWTIKNDAEVNMNAMFFNANRFNQDVSMWDVSRVRFMQYMFFSCADMSFGFDGWDTSSVDNFYKFANSTDVLDTSFGYLDISSALQLGLFKDGGQTISTENYNNTLIGWAAQTVNPNLTTSFGSATYSYSAFDARKTLTSAPNNWAITDGGYVPTDNAFQFTVNPNLQTLGNQLTDVTNGTPVNPTHWANATATSVDFIEVATTGVSYYEDVTPSLEAGEKYKLELTISNYNQIASGGNMGWSSQNTGSLDGLSLGGDGTVQAYFVSPGGPLRIYGRAGVATASMSFSCKKVNSDTNQFEIPLLNQGTQDFVVDWGDGTQDKITAWDDAAKLHSYYTYGSELVSGGTFTTQSDVDLWTGYNDGVLSLSNGRLLVTPSSSNSGRATQGITTVPGHTYILSLNFENPDSSNVLVGFSNNANGSGATYTTSTSLSGSFNFYYTATATTTYVSLSRLANDTKPIYYDNVSVVEQTPDTTPKTISIDGTIQGWQFDAPGDYLKLNNINRWGALDIHNTAMFFRCANMTCTATDAPVVTTTNFHRMFRGCNNFNGAIGNWNVSGVTSFAQSLMYCINLNQPLNNWDVSGSNNFSQMFHGSTNFAQDLNDWQINNSEIVTMYAMFYNCTNFNGDIYSWDTSKVLNMSLMLYNCDSFDQSLAAWNIEDATNFTNFMQNATGLSTSNYNLTLVSWAHQNVNSGLSVDFGGSQYSAGGAAEASRNILTSAPNNWTISDGGSV